MNPSTADIVAAIEATPATEVIVLPNNSNVILSAEQAAKLVDKPVRVIPSRSMPAGLAAIVGYLPVAERRGERGGDAARRSTRSRPARSRSRRATSSSTASTSARATGSASPTAQPSPASPTSTRSPARSSSELLGDGREVLTLLTGEDEPDLDGLLAPAPGAHPGVELDVQHGGQPHYPLLLSAE